jgi:tetratricopeptide (TPR) repeat protein
MKTLALHEMGEVIRKVRKERGLRLEDLADENISPATVSNIERGIAHVSPEKITYLLGKLELSVNNLPEMLSKEQEVLEKVKFKLLTIATLCTMDHHDEALDQFEKLTLDENHPYIAHAYYLKGKCYAGKKKWKQAKRAFYNALRISQQNPYKENNMEAASYLLLGLTSYYQDNLEQALEYTNNGIDTFVKKGENEHIQYLLYRYKGLYLQRLQRITEGMRLIQEIWPSISQMDDVTTILSFYWLRAEFSRLSGFTKEAAHSAIEGIEIARRNQQYPSMYDLWLTLGNTYTVGKEWDLAETAFHMALKLEGKLPDDPRRTHAYIYLSLLYTKQNKNEEAHRTIQTAIQSAEKHNDSLCLADALSMMGELCQRTDQLDEAISYYNKAIQITDKYNYKDKEANIWLKLAHCYDGKNEQEFQHCMRNLYHIKKEGNYLGHSTPEARYSSPNRLSPKSGAQSDLERKSASSVHYSNET